MGLISPTIYKIECSDRLQISFFLSTFVTSKVTIMNTRLKQFLAAENITQAQFADNINVVRASVSHVLSGRNNPSYEFIRSIMLKYPTLNIEWLMFGKGKMYRDEGLLFPDEHVQEVEIPPIIDDKPDPVQATTEMKSSDNTRQVVTNQRKVEKIILLFDDGSYQEINEISDTHR